VDTIELGDVTVTRLVELNGRLGDADEFFPDAPADAWAPEWLAPDFYEPSDNGLIVPVQTWVLRSAGRTVVVDTGIGDDKDRPQYPPTWHRKRSGHLAALVAAGVRPEDVDVVVNTHMHVDHVGWNTRLDGQDWVPTFPNATYLMARPEFEYWDPRRANAPQAVLDARGIFTDSVAPVHDAGLLQLWEDELVIDENLRLAAAPGHTPGHSVLHLHSGPDRAVFVGDLLHSPMQLACPHHRFVADFDPAGARSSRLQVLELAADQQALVVPAHFGGHAAAEVRRDGNGFAISRWAGFSRLQQA
jgi:glyoxylase-like metal-dependent hydrolase (beta-lactamase superfamily II)